MRWACASIDRSASNGSARPIARAVPGMNWAMPSAPAGERANGLNPDSLYSCAASSVPATLQRRAAFAIAGANRRRHERLQRRARRRRPPRRRIPPRPCRR